MVLRGWEGWGVLSGVISFGCVTCSLSVADVVSHRFNIVPLMVGARGVFGWVGLPCDRVCGLGREFGPFVAVGEGQCLKNRTSAPIPFGTLISNQPRTS
jgi:hypothetical protein